MEPHITIGYFTNRNEPMFEWFLRSLKRETGGDFVGIQVILVDFHAEREGRAEWLKKMVEDEGCADLEIRHTTPKPSICQGKHKITKNEYFAASNARNTAFALCKHPFIACVDDLSVLMPGWFCNVRHAQANNYLVMGAYKKVLKLDLPRDGELTYEPFPPGVDSRFWAGSDGGIVKAEGTWLFGCSFGLPIEWALKVNGFDEICDMQGAEDYDFGIRLDRAGLKMNYNRNMLTLESEEMHGTPGNQKFIREMKMMNYDGQRMGSDHVALRRVTREKRTRTISNQYDLRDLRTHMLNGGDFPIIRNPRHDWRDGQPLEEM